MVGLLLGRVIGVDTHLSPGLSGGKGLDEVECA